MKFVCDRCQTKYSIADEKVRGKILKVRCKSCANIITVREEGARRPSSPAIPVSGTAPATGSAPRATIVAPRLPTPPPAPPVERRAAARPPAPPVDDGVVWYMALDGNRTGPFSRKQLVDQVAPLAKDADIHVWNDRLGSWKDPMDVPALANEIHARRRPPVPVPPMPPLPAGPPAAPPFAGGLRRPTGSSFPVAAAPAAGAPSRPTGSHGIVPAAVSPGLGSKLPPPAGGRKNPSGVFPRAASLAASAAAPASADEAEVDVSFGEPEPAAPSRGAEARRTGTSHPALDSSSLLETPAPVPAMLHGLATNGVSHGPERAEARSNGAGSHSSSDEEAEVHSGLNLSSGASGAVAAPRLMSSESVVGWQPSAGEPAAARQKTTRSIVAVIGITAFIVALLMFTVMKKPKPVTPPPPAKAATTDPLAAVVENPNLAAPSATAPAPAPVAPAVRAPEPAPSGSRRSSHGHGSRGRGAPVAAARSTTPPATAPTAAADDANSKYRDSHNLNITAAPSAPRPPPSQSEISRVINNNRGGIKNCYQRALLRDNSLTHGKITVKVNIGISGRVKHVGVDGPPQFRAIDPCIREIVGRWAFPPAGEEYGTEFVYVFQGND